MLIELIHQILEASHILQSMLRQDRHHVCFCYVISKSTIPEDASYFTTGRKLFLPFHNAMGYRLDFVPIDGTCEAHNEHTTANRVDLFAADGPCLDRHAEVESQ